jgi:putative protease
MHYLREQQVESILASFEMTLPQLRDLSKAVPVEVLVYGRLPLMLMENCVIKNRTGNCSCNNPTRLIDRMGEEFPILKDGNTCRNVMYNGKKLYILDKLSSLRGMGIWAHRLNFTTENPIEVDAVLGQYLGRGDFDPGTCTRGLYARGVE